MLTNVPVLMPGDNGSPLARQRWMTRAVRRTFGWLMWTPMLRCLGCNIVGLTTLTWPEVLTITMPLSDLILLSLARNRGMTAALMLDEMFALWACSSELTLLTNMTIGPLLVVCLWVCPKTTWTRCLDLFMNPPSSLGFPIDRNMLSFVLAFLVSVPVMVPVTSAPLPFGELHSSMFPGGPRLQCLNSL